MDVECGARSRRLTRRNGGPCVLATLGWVLLLVVVLSVPSAVRGQEASLADQVKNRPQRSVGVSAKLDYSSTTGGGAPDFSAIAAGGNINVTLLDQERRHEVGLAFAINSASSGTADWETGSTSYTPNVFYRINTDPLGPAGSLVLFLGAQVGLNISHNFQGIPAAGGRPAASEQTTTLSWSTGPQFGALFFISAKTAAQVQYDLVFTETASPAAAERLLTIRNTISLGIRHFF